MSGVKRILHPTDFSQHSEAAFRLACELAQFHGAQILVLHVHQAPVGVAGTVPIAVLPAAPQQPEREQLERIQPATADLKVERRLEVGDPGQLILAVANEWSADLIVLGTHGRAELRRVLLGSVAEQVAQQAKCTVIMVKPSAR